MVATWRGENMHVVGHQHVGVNIAPGGFRRLLQTFEIEQIIVRLEKAGLTIVATLNHVLWHINEIEAGQAGHGYRVVCFEF